MKYDDHLVINDRIISINEPTYFIADIASNHDGDMNRAIDLIGLAKEAGADAVKFQHFQAPKIVSDFGFKNLGGQMSHQSSWKKSVFEVYKQYECKIEWTRELIKAAQKAGIHFFTTPYDFEVLNEIESVPAYKIGSGDITWIAFIEEVAKKGKPVILSTGASNMDDVERAVNAILKYNGQIALLQCNTNYTGNIENFKYINLNVLQTYAIRFPHMLLGLSDHTPGDTTVLGAVALGARLIEKHFTNDKSRIGPDHAFSMNNKEWADMVNRCRELEAALGSGVKRVAENELDTIVIQRRCLRFTKDMLAGDIIRQDDLIPLRPAPKESLEPYLMELTIGKKLINSKKAGDALFTWDLEQEKC